MTHNAIGLGTGAVMAVTRDKVAFPGDKERKEADRKKLKAFLDDLKTASAETLEDWLAVADKAEKEGTMSKAAIDKLRGYIKERLEIAKGREARGYKPYNATDDLVDKLTDAVTKAERAEQAALGNDMRDDVRIPVPLLKFFNHLAEKDPDQFKTIKDEVDTGDVDKMSKGIIGRLLGKLGVKDTKVPPEGAQALKRVMDNLDKKRFEKVRDKLAEALGKKYDSDEAYYEAVRRKADETNDLEALQKFQALLPDYRSGMPVDVIRHVSKKISALHGVAYEKKEATKKANIDKLLTAKEKDLDFDAPWYHRAINDIYDSAQVAKFMRLELKKKFPGTQFSVKTDKYSGGSSIRIHYTNGPPEPAVEKIVNKYSEDRGDPHSDYRNVNRYVFLSRAYTQDEIDKAIAQHNKEWGAKDHYVDYRSVEPGYRVRKMLKEMDLKAVPAKPDEGKNF